MPTPDFVLDLRRRIGHDPLWLPGVTAIVLDTERTRVLLVRRADDGRWTPVTGIIDPGEEPAQAGAREVLEEAGVIAQAERLVSIRALPEITHPNGDRAQYLDICFLFHHVSGDPYPADGENTAARWFDIDDLPTMNDRFHHQLAAALSADVAARFRV